MVVHFRFSKLIFSGSNWKKIISDTNAAAQEKGLDAVLVFLDRAKHAPKYYFPLNLFHFFREAPTICPLLIEKCLGGREKTKNKAIQALLLCIEIEAVEPVIVIMDHQTNLISVDQFAEGMRS